ncbi:PREDICTED: brefeldin A-inhibited guanine nucleotide-exchange protein 3-like, partial [Priapulus caudatus]|uniref:Brefeldin A-inhibited guanine nucleotide-exchange protein 3-like n=1 Tax=Priapulus caudatus TaxID=37621 RepID=A0ABM1F7F4_PRICU
MSVRGEYTCRAEFDAYIATATLESLDNSTGILRVWFLLLEGLAGAAVTCPRAYQPHTLELLFSLLQESAEVPGVTFAVYCVNHLLLPMLQGWMRRNSQVNGFWESSVTTNFKQSFGMCSDIVMKFVTTYT